MVNVLDEIALIADLGFDFIDLTLEPRETYSATIEVDRVAAALRKAKLAAIGHTAWYLPIASAFPEFRDLAVRELERCIRVFADLGVARVNLHPHLRVPLHGEEWIVAQNIEALAKLVQAAGKANMKVMLENMPGFSRVSQLKPILDAVPDAELLLDVGHANLDTPYNRSEELLANFGDRLAHVHVSDNRGGHDDMHLPLGVGNIDWLKVVRALKNVGYDSTITIEVFGDDDDYLVMSRNKLKRLWDSAEAGED
jgi:sugar phosphate isomerase/epimerase